MTFRMPVTIDVHQIGSYKKLADKTAIPGGLPPILNESSHLYGALREELDLRLGGEGFRCTGYGDRYNSFFDYIRKTSEQGSSMKKAIDADFVSNRRILYFIARSPFYFIREPMEIQAIRRNGVIFLCDKAPDRDDQSDPCGYKFEQYMTLDKDGNPRDKYEKVSNAECAKSVLRTTISNGKDELKVLYAAEMDAIDKEGNYVEMKTTALSHHKCLEKQSINHYLQSYLGGVPYIIYGQKRGYREPIVFRTRKVWTNDIPKERVHWNKDICFKQLFDVLAKIQSKLEYDEEALVLKICEDGLFFEPECSNNCDFLDPDFFDYFEN